MSQPTPDAVAAALRRLAEVPDMIWNTPERVAQAQADVETVRLAVEDAARESDNTRGVLEAYKAHHAHYHPDCNISGPPAPPRLPFEQHS